MTAALGILGLLVTTAPLRAIADAPDAAAERRSLAERAAAAEQALELEDASQLWLELVARDDLDEAERLHANYKAGELARILGRDVEARMHFVYVLERQPEFAVPASTPPKVRLFFEVVRQEVHARPPAARVVAPSTARVDAAPVATVAEAPPTPPWLLVGASASAGTAVLAVAGGVLLGLQADAVDRAAGSEPVQRIAAERYGERDQLALYANLAYGAGGILLLAGAGLALADLIGLGE